ncbi:microcin C ABC transporter permease YejB [Devosia sp. CN2-171]|uniref:microcin C ABC transporter permease YejB n=1 Tax=Devosia sp. CN2-171 TaxID=3400909 RepID=UPI003BF89642
MGAYILRRLLLMIPTLFGMLVVSFFITQFAPGGPVESYIAQISGQSVSVSEGVIGNAEGDFAGQNVVKSSDQNQSSTYRGAQGIRPEILARIEKQFGFDKPPLERFFTMLWKYARFDFGDSYSRGVPVIDLIIQKLPVSITLGLWMTILSYGISIPLGIAKAVKDGTRFDVSTSTIVIIGYSLPDFVIGVLLIVLFAGGNFLDIFPLRGLVSENWASLPWYSQILDYLWHIVLPITAMALGAFATSTMLIKNSFIDEIRKQYVMVARAKGLTENRVLYGHVFRNAMLLVIAGFPAAFVGAFFGGSLLIETVFSLDGLGYLGYQSVINRDYSVVFATFYIFSLVGLVLGLISDLMYMWIDPRIDFESRKV